MKKVVFGLLFCIAVALAAQSGTKEKTRVAVFPFEIADGAVNESEAVTIREDFSNRLAQTGLFELVPRTDVDKLFRQEASFQLNNLSDASKTAEYGRVLNANWIIAGRLSKAGTRLALVVSMYTYPDFVQKPGAQVYASDIDTLVDNIPTMIATIEKGEGVGGAATSTAPKAQTAAPKPAASPAKSPASPRHTRLATRDPQAALSFLINTTATAAGGIWKPRPRRPRQGLGGIHTARM